MPITFAILGSGGWGTAMAVLLAHNRDHRVRLWSAHAESARRLCEDRENVQLLPGVTIPPAVLVTADEAEATAGADCWIVAVPTAFLRTTIARFARANFEPVSRQQPAKSKGRTSCHSSTSASSRK